MEAHLFPASSSPARTRTVSVAEKETMAFTRLRIKLTTSNLVMSASREMHNPFIVVETLVDRNQWTERGRTEIVSNSSNPSFSKELMLDYYFYSIQFVRLTLYDANDQSDRLADYDMVGQCEFPLAQLISPKNMPMHIVSIYSRNRKAVTGSVHISVAEIEAVHQSLVLQSRCRGLIRSNVFLKTDPYFTISIIDDQGILTKVWQSEIVRRTTEPEWTPFWITMLHLCDADYDRPFQIDVWDWKQNGAPELLGSFKTTMGNILSDQNEYPLENPSFRTLLGPKPRDFGSFLFTKYSVSRDLSFLDHLHKGLEIVAHIAIDFTGSNGNPHLPSSNHYKNREKPNDYVEVLNELMGVLKEYTKDEEFHAYGFGAQIPPEFSVSHCFPLGVDFQSSKVASLDSMLDCYYSALDSLRLSGPTIFSQILKHVMSHVERESSNKYHILLLLTDDDYTDVYATSECFAAMNLLPMSTIVVGIGNSSFEKLDQINYPETYLNKSGTKSTRQCTQFVAFKQYKSNTKRLARKILGCLPYDIMAHTKTASTLHASDVRSGESSPR